MTGDELKTVDEAAQRALWETPALTRIEAGEAEASGAVGDDGVIGNS